MRKIKRLIFLCIAIYAVAYYFDIDMHGAFSTAKTYTLDAIGKVFPDAKGHFENIDSQINSAIVKNETAKIINNEAQKAIEKTSTFLSQMWLSIKRFLRKYGINLSALRIPKNQHLKNPAPTYSFDYENISIQDVSSVRQNFINYSMTLRGTPYVLGSKNPAIGLDCSGFVQYAAKNGANVQLPNTAKGQYDATVRIPSSEREPGDLVFFRRFGQIDHVGIYLGRYEGSGSLHGREIFINSASE